MLTRAAWTERADAHAERVDQWVVPHLDRRRRNVPHPVHDFLFTYYAQSPAALRTWHPGWGVVLDQAPEYADRKGYATSGGEPGPSSVSRPACAVSAEHLASQRDLVESTRRLLVATAARPPSFGCFGLHEWAMLHRTSEPRHPWPLRLGARGTDEVVESQRISCSHFDAFRFFTASARPLNALQPGRDDRAAYEQPGCLHAGMDLYGRAAVGLSPLIASELVADAFALAWDIRILDMRAAPYDLTGLILDPTGEPWTPVPIESSEGRAEYVRLQRELSERATPIRQRLIEECDRLLEAGAGVDGRGDARPARQTGSRSGRAAT